MKLKLFPVAIAVLAALVLTATASASKTASQTKHDRDVIRFFDHHRSAARTPQGQRVLWTAIHHVVDVERSLESARSAALLYPPHHQLWLCIHGGEGNWNDQDSGGNGHYGGLQMHPGWGYGTSYDAGDDSESVQEWAAERGYRASGRSIHWLDGQWGADAHCFTSQLLAPSPT